jgi:hypothetical protein
MKYKSTYLASLVLSFLSLFEVICPSANATYIATLDEIGGNVVGTGSGSFDLTELTFEANVSDSAAAVIFPTIALLFLGSGGPLDIYSGISGPTNFGFGGFTPANSQTGNIVGVFGGAVSLLHLPQNYMSATPLGTSTGTWNSATFASLGLTPGTYVWTWGSGIHADSFTLQIGPTNGVPETGSTIALMLGAVGTLIAFRQKLLEKLIVNLEP